MMTIVTVTGKNLVAEMLGNGIVKLENEIKSAKNAIRFLDMKSKTRPDLMMPVLDLYPDARSAWNDVIYQCQRFTRALYGVSNDKFISRLRSVGNLSYVSMFGGCDDDEYRYFGKTIRRFAAALESVEYVCKPIGHISYGGTKVNQILRPGLYAVVKAGCGSDLMKQISISPKTHNLSSYCVGGNWGTPRDSFKWYDAL